MCGQNNIHLEQVSDQYQKLSDACRTIHFSTDFSSLFVEDSLMLPACFTRKTHKRTYFVHVIYLTILIKLQNSTDYSKYLNSMPPLSHARSLLYEADLLSYPDNFTDENLNQAFFLHHNVPDLKGICVFFLSSFTQRNFPDNSVNLRLGAGSRSGGILNKVRM